MYTLYIHVLQSGPTQLSSHVIGEEPEHDGDDGAKSTERLAPELVAVEHRPLPPVFPAEQSLMLT